ncbi:MAG: T9SS type A sorting domain-containing protein, partial [Bacteroidota bacterium]
ATVNAVSPDPLVTNVSRCGNGSIDLSIPGNDTISWFNSPNGSLLYTGHVFTTPSLAQTTTYSVRAGGICPSQYVPVVATINALPLDPVVTSGSNCGPGSINISANSADTIRWYDAPGGNLLSEGIQFATQVLNQTVTYFVQAKGICAGNFIPVDAIINSISPDAVVSNQSRCGDGVLTLNASSNDTIRWYDSPNGSLLGTGNNFTTPSLTSTTNYFVRAEGICPGNFISVSAVILPVPVNPVVSDQLHCGPGTVTLNAVSSDTIRWYDSPNGNLLATGGNFTTQTLTSNTIYFVRAEGICPGNFISVNAVILPVPASPVVSNQIRCGTGTVTLNAFSTDTIRWYDSPNGNLLATGTSFTTPVLSQTNSYSVSTQNICISNFVQVQAIIHSIPADPALIPGSTCGSGEIVLIGSSPDTISWFDAPNGTLLGTGITFQTPVLNVTTTYYAAVSNGCHGNFIPVNAVVFPLPQISLGNDTIIESGSTVSIDAGQGFATYLWNTGETTQVANANSTGNYWVIITDQNGCTSSDTIQVLVTVDVQPYVLADGVLIYPNPTHSTLSISFVNEMNEDIFLRLLDSNGKLVWSDFSVREKRVMRSIDLSQFARGIYIFQMSTPKEKREYKVVLK